MRNKLFLAVVAAVFVLGGLSVYWWYQVERRTPAPSPSQEAYFLILGLDSFGERQRSDTIMVAKLGEDGVKLLSIPRDLRVQFSDGTFHKINAAYAEGGPELVRRLVSDLLGVPLHWHAVVDYQGFVRFVDAVGGVTVTIESPMRYEDTKQGLVIDLPAGTRTLTGEEALDYWRYRDAATEEDLGRIRRQQGFLKALVEKLSQIESTSRLQALVQTVLEGVKTNLAAVDAYRLAERLRGLGPEALKTAVLPGRPRLIEGISYFVADPMETAAVVEEFFRGREVLTNRDVAVIVLNGHPDPGVRPGLARSVSASLGEQGFRIVAYWNADAFDYPTSYLIDVGGGPEKVQRLANTLEGVPLVVLSQEAFRATAEERLGRDSLREIEKTLLTTAIPPDDRGVELSEADAVLILGGGFTKEVLGE